VALGRWADVMLLAPLSCNTLAKMAVGICDNLLLAVYLSSTCPVIVAPAMDEDMWHHPATKANLQKINSYGNTIIPVEKGELASGLHGEGRMAEPETIFNYISDFFLNSRQLSGKKVMITAGPTYEAIDPVRYISNHSTGKMGIALAKEFKKRGAAVTLIIGPTKETLPVLDNIIPVTSAAKMLDACKEQFKKSHIAVMNAAVADYTPVQIASQKIKKQDATFSIDLKKTTDILKHLGTQKKKNQILVGFALETTDEKKNALKKLKEKNADFIILNSLNDKGAGFGYDTNKITIFDKSLHEFHFDMKSKNEIAADIVNTIVNSKYE
jgi:phosphopantothenoylcysteine decarboxylase/phosphopantothenate--cysteine ligase